MQALERNVEAGSKIDTYEIEGSDRAELLQDLAEFNLAVVRSLSDPDGILEADLCIASVSLQCCQRKSAHAHHDCLRCHSL